MDGEQASEVASDTQALRARAAQFLAWADDNLLEARERARRARQMDEISAKLAEYVERDELSEAERFLSASGKTVEALGTAKPEFAEAIAHVRSELERLVRARWGEVERAFGPAAREAGLEPDSGSRHPKYTFFGGFVSVAFDKSRLETRISPRDGRKMTLGVDLPVVMARLIEEQRRLFGRPFDPHAFALQLLSACQTVQGSERGKPIPIRDVASAYCKSTGASQDEFNVDLSKLLRSGAKQAGEFKLDHTREAKHGLLLWQLDDRGYYGYISNGEGSARNDEQVESGSG